jgi:hypothetical protein
MPLIDLRNHIVQKDGTWCDEALLAQETPFRFSLADTLTAGRLMLRWPGDVVVLTGPLRLRLTYQSENLTFRTASVGGIHRAAPLGMLGQLASGSGQLSQLAAIPINAASLQASTLYTYTLDISAGEVWWYKLGEQDPHLKLGANHGVRLLVEAALGQQVLQPLAQVSDLPCDFAVADLPDTSHFFPTACEPCAPGAQIGLPPGGPSLAIPSADGGCIRPRFFNGMFITKEDLETEQRYMRMKLRMQNRASGQGVVWGLNVGKQGNTVCVLPGYATDCCGNDLTVTTLYKVDTATLLRDPAAAAALASGRPQRMHLLLEYVECPSDPRPVHADPCATGTDRCEMSRVRETVRLRLVPPRDPSTLGPIQTFIDRVRSLRAKYGVGDSIPERPTRAPFQVVVTADTLQMGSATARIRPGETPSLEALTSADGVHRLRVRLEFDSGAFNQFARGTVDARTQDDSGVEQVLLNHAPLAPTDFEFNVGDLTLSDIQQQGGIRLHYVLSDWTTRPALAPEDAPWLRGNLALEVVVFRSGRLEARVNDDGVTAMAADLGQGCAGDPCVPDGAAPVLPQLPWLHTDPLWNDTPAEPKALILAALGGWLTELSAREQVGTPKESLGVRRLLATTLYDSAWLLFYGVEQGENRNDIHESLRQLFRAWCENLIYKGPQCAGEPHGVVIGCTQVAGGTLGDIDPFGGRRWVMHAPLLSHWGTQFGMAPLDVTASRFFSTICCISALPAIGNQDNPPAMVLEIGDSFLTFGTPEDVAQKLGERDVEVVESKTAAAAEFVAYVIAAMSQRRDGEEPRRWSTGIRYTLGNPMAPKVLSVVMEAERRDREVRPIRGEDNVAKPAGPQPIRASENAAKAVGTPPTVPKPVRPPPPRPDENVAKPVGTPPPRPDENVAKPAKPPARPRAENVAAPPRSPTARPKKDRK